MAGRGGTIVSPKVIQAFGIAAVLCYVAVARIRGGRRHRRGSASRGLLKHERERLLTGHSAECCEGFVDLIRESESRPPAPLEVEGDVPSMTQKELTHALLVVVVIGPGSTKVYKVNVRLVQTGLVEARPALIQFDTSFQTEGYVITKLLRYLRWSNLVRKHFSVVDNDQNLLYDHEEDGGQKPADSRETTGKSPNGLTNGNGHGPDGRHVQEAAPDRNGAGLEQLPAGGSPGSQRHDFSERGKATALATIAVQESARKVADWLNALSAGGVAVVEAGAGWASTRHGRETLRDRLLQTTTPELGILWLELLPSGLFHKSAANTEAFTARGTEMAVSATNDTRPGSWKSANGLPCPPQGLGSRVVDYFLRSGNLVGAGGHVFYESVRRGSQGDGSARKTCFVSLAEEGADIRSQLQEGACPLARRVGNFAAALKMKKAWHDCPVFLTRHGESLMNQEKTMGGDTRLSETGDRYAGVLADFVAAQADAGQSRLSVWCSPMRRAVQTARAIKCQRYTQWQALTELDTGVFNGWSYRQAESEFPEEFAAREKDKLHYHYPEGESYLDVVNRLDPVVVALEKQDGPVVIISHQAVLRCLYAYFLEIPLRVMPRVAIELHTVVKLTPCDDHRGGTSRWKETRFALIKPTPLEQLTGGVATMGGLGHRRVSQLGERLS